MNDLASVVFNLNMRKIESPHDVERHVKYFVGPTPAARRSQVLPQLSQSPKDSRSIETLTLAVFAKVRHGIHPSDTTAVRWL